jgi:hypothetical protein
MKDEKTNLQYLFGNAGMVSIINPYGNSSDLVKLISKYGGWVV